MMKYFEKILCGILCLAFLFTCSAPAAFAAAADGRVPVLLRFDVNAPLPRISELREKYGLDETALEYVPGVANVYRATLEPDVLRRLSAGEPGVSADFNLKSVQANENAVKIVGELFGFVAFAGENALYAAADSRIEKTDGGWAVRSELLTVFQHLTVTTYLQKRINGEYVTVDVWDISHDRKGMAVERDFEKGEATVDANGKYYFVTALADERALRAGADEDFRTVTMFDCAMQNSAEGFSLRVVAYPDGSRTNIDASIPAEEDELAVNGESKRPVSLEYFCPISDSIQSMGKGAYLTKRSELEQRYGMEPHTLNVNSFMNYCGWLTEEQIEAIARDEYVAIYPGFGLPELALTFITGDIFGYTFRYRLDSEPDSGARYVSVGGDAALRDGSFVCRAEALTLEKNVKLVTLLQKKENGKYVTVDSREKSAAAPEGPLTEADVVSGAAAYDPGAREYLYNLSIEDERTVELPDAGEYRAKVVVQYGTRIAAVDLYPDGSRQYCGDPGNNGNADSRDARYTLRCAARLEDLSRFLPEEKAFEDRIMDFDGDGRVTSADARAILRLAARVVA